MKASKAIFYNICYMYVNYYVCICSKLLPQYVLLLGVRWVIYMLDNSIKTNSCRLPSLVFFSAEHQGGSSLSRKALEVTTVIALRCIPWRTVLKLSTITCSAG